MAERKPTPAQMALLTAVAEGRVHRAFYDDVLTEPGGATRIVTSRMARLREAGRAHLPSRLPNTDWVLTVAGRAVLEAHRG